MTAHFIDQRVFSKLYRNEGKIVALPTEGMFAGRIQVEWLGGQTNFVHPDLISDSKDPSDFHEVEDSQDEEPIEEEHEEVKDETEIKELDPLDELVHAFYSREPSE